MQCRDLEDHHLSLHRSEDFKYHIFTSILYDSDLLLIIRIYSGLKTDAVYSSKRWCLLNRLHRIIITINKNHSLLCALLQAVKTELQFSW